MKKKFWRGLVETGFIYLILVIVTYWKNKYSKIAYMNYVRTEF